MGAPAAATTYVGRARELGVLEHALEDARAGRAATVLVCGEAGLGKSRLVGEFASRARDSGARVLVGGCLPMGESLPFTPVVEALRDLAADVGIEPLRRLAGDQARELRRLLPALGTPPEPALDAGASQVRLFEAVLGLLVRLGRDRPHVLVLEDVHWVDPSTRDLLLFLAHNLRDAAVVLVATLRDDEVDGTHPMRPVLTRLGRDARARRVDLAGLSDADVAHLLESLLAAPPRRELVELVVDRAQGNPFFVEELVAAGARAGMSATLREVLLASIEVLPDETRRVLRLAAAAGRRVPHDLLARAGELDEANLEAALRPAVDRRVLLANQDAGSYAFRHDLLAEAVESTLLPGERRRIHRALAEVLADDPVLATRTPAAELAHHWHVAGDRARALAASLEAAREAVTMHATGEALVHVDRLVALFDQVPDAAARTGLDRAGVLAWQADLAHDTGQVRRAVTVMRAALDAVPDDDTSPERLAGMWERLARYVSSADGYTEAMPTVERAVALVTDAPWPRTRARVHLLHAHALWEVDPGRALAIARDQLAVVTDLGDRELEGIAHTFVGSGLAATGHLDEGVEHLRRAAAIAEELGGAEDLARATNLWSGVLVRGGRAAEGAAVSLDALDRVRELGVDRAWGSLLAGNATSGLFWAGRWDEAEVLVGEAAGEGVGVGWLLLLQARLRAHRGRVAEARRLLAEGDRHGNASEPRRLAVALTVELAAGDLDAAHALVVGRHDAAVPTHAATAGELAAWALRVEGDRVAAGLADRATVQPLADALLAETDHDNRAGVAHAEPWQHTAAAEHARLVGAPHVVDAWQIAVDAWEQLGWVPPLAHARLRLGEALADDGGATAEAEGLLRTVHATAVELGAEVLQDEVARVARRVGVRGLVGASRGPREAGDHPRGLTPREQEVLGLVVAGATNPEVGRALHISDKTASVHVSNILRKLDVASRTEAAAVAVREGLVAEGA